MKYLLIFTILLFSSRIFSIPLYNINLDNSNFKRWEVIAKENKEIIRNYTEIMLKTVNNLDILLNLINSYLIEYQEKHPIFYEEINSISFYTEISISKIFLINFMYELLSGCTAIIYQKNDENVILGKNLDYFYGEVLQKSIVLLDFYKNGNLLYRGHAMAGMIGIFSGSKREKFSLTINQKTNKTNLIAHFQYIFSQSYLPNPYTIRKTFEKDFDFLQALNFLSFNFYPSPCYLIIAGIKKNEGCILTFTESLIEKSCIDLDENIWFLVQTNSDRKIIDIRRSKAEKRIIDIGNNTINEKKLMENVLNLEPNKNKLTLMISILNNQIIGSNDILV